MKKWFIGRYSESVFRNIRFFCVLYSVTLGFGCAIAQQTAYSCDFEDEYENSQWNLNVGNEGSKASNKWFISTATDNGGDKSLYVSSDPEGKTTDYVSKGLTIVSSRTLSLPAGYYELSFDWQAVGLPSDGLYVCWMPDSVISPSSNSTAMPQFLELFSLDFGGKNAGKLNSSSWQTVSDTIYTDGSPYKLVFVWRNGVISPAPPAACIDNIYILPVGLCQRPYDISVTSDFSSEKIYVSWKGNADAFDLRCSLPDNPDWVYMTDIATNSVEIENTREGSVNVYIRSKCGDEHTAWVSSDYFVWFPGLRCVDLFDLSDANCYVGSHKKTDEANVMIDYGYRSMQSRHTIHYDIYETDPRTDGRVRTVPDGEVASVRLGNWNVFNEAEAIEYKYHVDAERNAVMLLKYAAVLQDPGHESGNQPRFSLRVLGEDGMSVDSICIDEDFVAGNTTSTGWVQANAKGEVIGGMIESSLPAIYKNWTTIGVNLKDYDGRDLTIRLTSYDCAQLGHYGYAYFTINCTDAKVRGLSCGSMDENIFEAPDGFLYHWYLADDHTKKMVSDKQRLVVENSDDTRTYACDVISLTDAGCYYTIYAVAEPRFPYPDLRFSASRVGCENTVVFMDNSHVVRVNPETNDTTHEDILCDSVLYNFDLDNPYSKWVKDENPVKMYPRDGGTFRVGVKAFLAECVEIQELVLDLPSLDYSRDTIYFNRCSGDDGVEFAGGIYYETGLYSDTILSPDGLCDSISFLSLNVVYPSDTIIADTVCSSELPYVYMGNDYDKSGEYKIVTVNHAGCDSIISLCLTVNRSLDLDIDSEFEVCADDSFIIVNYRLLSGMVSFVDFHFDDAEIDELIGFDNMLPNEDAVLSFSLKSEILPGRYNAKLVFHNFDCGNLEKECVISVLYPDSIITQRWNDVLALKNSMFNGGYEFVSFQWYKDMDLIEGATSAIYYADTGLDTTATYSVAVTRADDGVTAFTCKFSPVKFLHNEVADVPIVTLFDNVIKISAAGKVSLMVYSPSGLLLTNRILVPGESQIVLDYRPGVYIIHLIEEEGKVSVHRIVLGR